MTLVVLAGPALAKEPTPVAFDKLPKPIRALHSCVNAQSKLEMASERYAKSVLFIVSCPAPRGAYTPFAVYTARDVKARGAKRVRFETLAPDGTPATADTLVSAVPAREAYTKEGDLQPHTRVNNEVPWIAGAWRPEDRAGVCAIAANWRIQGDKGELWLWDEAKECPKDAQPKYESKVDKKSPPLVSK